MGTNYSHQSNNTNESNSSNNQCDDLEVTRKFLDSNTGKNVQLYLGSLEPRYSSASYIPRL